MRSIVSLVLCLAAALLSGVSARGGGSAAVAPESEGPISMPIANITIKQRAPPNAGRLTSFIRMYNSRCITFIGDSVSREMHFSLLLFAFGCLERNPISQNDIKRRFEPRRINQTERCEVFKEKMKDRSNRVTRIPVDRDPSKDIIVRFIWARYIDELNKRNQLSAMLDLDACDVYVLNAGFWHLRMPRHPFDTVNASGQFREMMGSIGWWTNNARRNLIRKRVVWRSSTLIEIEQDMFANQHITRFNQRVDGTVRSFGLPVYNFERLFKGIKPGFRFKFTAVSIKCRHR